MISTRSIKLLKAFEDAVYQASLTHQTNYAVERRALERHIARLEAEVRRLRKKIV